MSRPLCKKEMEDLLEFVNSSDGAFVSRADVLRLFATVDWYKMFCTNIASRFSNLDVELEFDSNIEPKAPGEDLDLIPILFEE